MFTSYFQPKVRVANTESSYLISGLVPGVTYTVEVYAAINRLQSEADSIEATTGMEETNVIRKAESWNMTTTPVNGIVHHREGVAIGGELCNQWQKQTIFGEGETWMATSHYGENMTIFTTKFLFN